MIRKLAPLAALLLPTPALAAEPDCVVLLHGLARGGASMIVLDIALASEGFTTFNSAYDSTADTIENLAATALPEAIAACPEDSPAIHFVTHSMGGILLRQWFETNDLPNLGRTIMLAPPNRGSELVDEFKDLDSFDWIHGPAGDQLSTSGLPTRLGPLWPDVAIIAGNRSLNAYYSHILPGADDGKVSVASTKADGMATHLTLPVTHTFMMNNPVVVGQVLAYIRDGAFTPDMELTDVLETFTD